MSARSMTGFARVRKHRPEGEIVLSIKSVNHRALDPHFHLPAEFDACEPELRAAVKEKVARGHLQINVAFHRAAPSGGCLNRPLLDAYLAAFREASAGLDPAPRPDLNAALQVPGMFAPAEADAGEDLQAALLEAMGEALDALNAFREREADTILAELYVRCDAILAHAARMEEIRATATEAFHTRLQERLREVLRNFSIDPQRLAQEAAILADRSDISEELIRLKTHAAQLREILAGGGEIGKKIDFLLQEMNRETNTILSKTGGLGTLGLTVTELGLAAKAEIDKVREQGLNLE